MIAWLRALWSSPARASSAPGVLVTFYIVDVVRHTRIEAYAGYLGVPGAVWDARTAAYLRRGALSKQYPLSLFIVEVEETDEWH